MLCKFCKTAQSPSQYCVNCSTSMGSYYCDVCKIWNNIDKMECTPLFHCESCGICRQGDRENYFHCSKCMACLPIDLKPEHEGSKRVCVENILSSRCPICWEGPLFNSNRSVAILRCGHAIHAHCFASCINRQFYTCPFCMRDALVTSPPLSSAQRQQLHTTASSSSSLMTNRRHQIEAAILFVSLVLTFIHLTSIL
eukprot:TRINITY_DN9907_c0_g1_i1.p1 TRINITY_DN9907_c0_g1~~TRINITY_DN9907_c0_g1_i1.p1  ORF type:complete len:197 (+),score=14.13 TRINITY_DN9907_c0_g1_i1:199-789(+)